MAKYNNILNTWKFGHWILIFPRVNKYHKNIKMCKYNLFSSHTHVCITFRWPLIWKHWTGEWWRSLSELDILTYTFNNNHNNNNTRNNITRRTALYKRSTCARGWKAPQNNDNNNRNTLSVTLSGDPAGHVLKLRW